ncbi:Tat pathway signal sequence, partial [Cutibacterium acnes]
WLSVNDPTATKRESLTFMGQAVSLTARRNGLSFNMGDGHTVHCAATTPWSPSVEPGSPSPTCGYTYQQAAPAGGYKVTAITSWDVTWSVLGHTGTVHIQKAGGQMLPVGELESVVTRR